MLRRDEEAQRDLRHCLQQDPQCSLGYRLLGELCLRKDELQSANIFFREAIRMNPDDQDALEFLEIVTNLIQPTVVAEKLPAAVVTVGCSLIVSQQSPRAHRPRRLAHGTSNESTVPARAGTVDGSTVPARAGFGNYLVEIGALTPIQLKAALAYHQTSGVRIGGAASALGFVSQPKVEWAAHAYHSRPRSN